MKKVKNLMLGILIMGFFGCERTTFYNPYAQLEADIAKIDKYLEDNNITAQKSSSGLRYVIHDEGLGSIPQKGNVLIVHYTGTLFDGTKFDSSYDRGEPMKYQHGYGQVITGWEEGITYISERGRITLYVPSVLAYGSRSVGEFIEPNSNLIFDIELFSAQ
jgi:FKBP-type peptidyl-prolyl cis-trans isomerase